MSEREKGKGKGGVRGGGCNKGQTLQSYQIHIIYINPPTKNKNNHKNYGGEGG